MDTAPPSPPPRRWRRRLTIAALVLLALIVLPLTAFIGWQWAERAAAEKELQAALERTSQLDPRWRQDEIEEDRAAVPDEENSAPIVRSAYNQLPKGWPPKTLGDGWFDAPPLTRLREDQSRTIREELEKCRPALDEARRLKGHGRGRFPIQYDLNPLNTRVPHVPQTRTVANLLEADALLRADENDLEGALDSCRATLNAGRALGDDPFLIAVLYRLAIRSMTRRSLERILAQGEAPAPGLLRMQELLQDELKQNVLVQGLRGERAMLHGASVEVESGRIALADLTERSRPPQGWEHVSSLWVVPRVMRGHAELLDALNEAVEVAKLSPEERGTFFDDLRQRSLNMTPYARLLLPLLGKVTDADARAAAELRSSVAGLAAERYRLKYGRWPETLDALVPEFLPAVPADPYDGRPLRYRRLPEGAVVYSVGPDKQDDGGRLREPKDEPRKPGTDLGFRLWDVELRGQPPPPQPDKMPQDGVPFP
jgi:hypothetical protein